MKKRGKSSLISVILALIMFVSTFNVSAIVANADGGSDAAKNETSLEGIYSIQSAVDNSYLTNVNDKIVLQNELVPEACAWKVEEFYPDYKVSGNDRRLYLIKALRGDNRIDTYKCKCGDNYELGLYPVMNCVKNWNFEVNGDGTVTISLCNDSSYVIAAKDGKAVIQKRNGSISQKWIMQNCSHNFYKTIYSADGIVMMEVPLIIYKKVSDETLVKMANRWSVSYQLLCSLYGKVPYKRIIFDCCSSVIDNYYAYIYGGGDNHVYFTPQNFERFICDVYTYERRKNDWGFTSMHEMGHLFQSDVAWTFDKEVLADLSAAYVVEKTNSEVTTYFGSPMFDRISLKDEYFAKLANPFHNRTVYMLLQIKDAVGWEPFTKAFTQIELNQTKTGIKASAVEKFDNFINTLSYYAGVDVRQFVNPDEYAKLREYIKNNN